MNIKHCEIEIEQEEPFANCKLDREKHSDVLTNIIESYPNGFVLALNNKWGTGKTTFVKMWEQALKNKSFQTLYFNAWENDFEDNPLTALIGELNTLTTKDTEKLFKSILKIASTLTKNVAPIIVKSIAKEYLGSESIQKIIERVTQELSNLYENEVNEYKEKKESILKFKENLSKFIANINNKKPLIFIIDELDRCRPNYAVSTLEKIKHFFSVPNIVFVLCIDKEQLGNAIKGVYGSDLIDAEEYLRRFIDLEYSIPEPKTAIFYEYLYEYFEFDEFFQSKERLQYAMLYEDKTAFLNTCKLLFTNTEIPLRQQEKIFTHSRLALRNFDLNTYACPQIFLLLTFIKIRHNVFYEELKNQRLSFAEIQDQLISIINTKTIEEKKSPLLWTVIVLIHLNNNMKEEHHRKKLYEQNKVTRQFTVLNGSIIKENSEDHIIRILTSIKYPPISNLNLSFFTDKIDLLEALKT